MHVTAAVLGVGLSLAIAAMFLYAQRGVSNEDALEIAPAAGVDQGGPVTPGVEASTSLAQQAERILRQHCYSCHGEAGQAEGGFNFVLSVEKLKKGSTYISPGKPDESYLFERVLNSEMPPRQEAASLSNEEIDVLRRWIGDGAPDFAVQPKHGFVRFDDMFAAMRADLERTSQRSRRFIRYFSLTHLLNAGDSSDELQTYRLALTKMINSLSRSERIITPQPIDPQKTIFKVDLRDLDWTRDTWGKLVDASPYAVVFDSPNAKAVYRHTTSQVPTIRADWFVAAASKPPLYHDILRIPKTLDALLAEFRIDVQRNKQEDRALLVGFNRSGVSQNNRLIERHELPAGGYVWISSDFAGNTGRKNLLSHPLDFAHDGGEIIFSLPNGLQGYMLVDAKGNRIDRGPTTIVSDPGQRDRVVLNGISCISCHHSGIIPKADEVRSHVLQNRDSFASELDEILSVYRDNKFVEETQTQDAARFDAALSSIGIQRKTRSNEPVFNIAERFERELDAKLAAAELGLTVEELAKELADHDDLARVLGAVLSPGGVVKRDTYLDLFTKTIEEFGIAKPFRDSKESKPVTNAKPAEERPLAKEKPAAPVVPKKPKANDHYTKYLQSYSKLNSQKTESPRAPCPPPAVDEREPLPQDSSDQSNQQIRAHERTLELRSEELPYRRWRPTCHPSFYGRLTVIEYGRFYVICRDGLIVEGPIGDLSRADRRYIERLIRGMNAAK
jgi:mono/diheme cytochrome c family protein